MWKIARGDPQGLVDCEEFLAFLSGLGEDPRPEVRDLFSSREEVLAARAPGRLDVMGGIADYSGARVLQLPLSLATWCAVQRRSDRVFRIYSVSPDQNRYAEVDWGLETERRDASGLPKMQKQPASAAATASEKPTRRLRGR